LSGGFMSYQILATARVFGSWLLLTYGTEVTVSIAQNYKED